MVDLKDSKKVVEKAARTVAAWVVKMADGRVV